LRGDVLSIGALTTYSDIIRSPIIRRRPADARAAARDGDADTSILSWQYLNSSTVAPSTGTTRP
jgi:CO/xanthine dehydrogenase FAD-binding subunit